MKKVLIIAAHRKDRAPNQRFRFEQYIQYLNDNGIYCHVSNIISESDDKILYQSGNYFSKAMIAVKATLTRLGNVWNRNKYDLIFVCREGFFTGTTVFEEWLHKAKAPMIYDFDDAIWHFDVSEANKNIGWMKNPGKTAKLISLADLVFAGNQYLADYAHHHNENILIVPTTIDTDEYKQTPFRDAEQLCIGWSGSITTIRHFEVVIPVLHRLKNKYGNKLVFKVIGDANFSVQELGIQGIRWSKQDELDELSKIDIGIMPLPDDEWSKGKCGLKGLQYMALGIATVMSPVGVNTEIIQNGTNGFLATTDDEWFGVLCQLIDDADLRKRMGEAARKTVVEKYSVESQKKVYYNAMMGLMTKN